MRKASDVFRSYPLFFDRNRLITKFTELYEASTDGSRRKLWFCSSTTFLCCSMKMSWQSTNFVLQHENVVTEYELDHDRARTMLSSSMNFRALARTRSYSSTGFCTRTQTRLSLSTKCVLGHKKLVLGHKSLCSSTRFSCSSRKYKRLTPLVHLRCIWSFILFLKHTRLCTFWKSTS